MGSIDFGGVVFLASSVLPVFDVEPISGTRFLEDWSLFVFVGGFLGFFCDGFCPNGRFDHCYVLDCFGSLFSGSAAILLRIVFLDLILYLSLLPLYWSPNVAFELLTWQLFFRISPILSPSLVTLFILVTILGSLLMFSAEGSSVHTAESFFWASFVTIHVISKTMTAIWVNALVSCSFLKVILTGDDGSCMSCCVCILCLPCQISSFPCPQIPWSRICGFWILFCYRDLCCCSVFRGHQFAGLRRWMDLSWSPASGPRI